MFAVKITKMKSNTGKKKKKKRTSSSKSKRRSSSKSKRRSSSKSRSHSKSKRRSKNRSSNSGKNQTSSSKSRSHKQHKSKHHKNNQQETVSPLKPTKKARTKLSSKKLQTAQARKKPVDDPERKTQQREIIEVEDNSDSDDGLNIGLEDIEVPKRAILTGIQFFGPFILTAIGPHFVFLLFFFIQI